MSIPAVKFTCLTIMAIMGLFVVKRISKSEEKLLNIKSIALMFCLMILPTIIYDLHYSYMFSLIIYIITMITYKYVLNISYIKSTFSCGIMLISLAIIDFISMCILVFFAPVEFWRNTWYTSIISNILFSLILLFIFYKTRIGVYLSDLVNKISEKKQGKIVFFFSLMLVAMSIVLYISSENYDISSMFTTNFTLFIILFLLVIILFTERNNYDKLSDDYDNLFEYVKVFEEWVEKEQFIRHEYKNQLAVIREMTKEKKVRNKIDSIVDDMINIDNEMIQELGGLPNGGLKGLLYYKIAIAKNNNVHIEVDVSNKVGKLFKKLDENKIRVLSKLIGVYCDNAIEASMNTDKKIVTIEIYNLDNAINMVISNTFDSNIDISARNENGISTKGEGRGHGLYLANKLLRKSNWICEKQQIMKNLYIQRIIIKM